MNKILRTCFSGIPGKVKHHEVPHMRHLIGFTELYSNISDPYTLVHQPETDHDLDQLR